MRGYALEFKEHKMSVYILITDPLASESCEKVIETVNGFPGKKHASDSAIISTVACDYLTSFSEVAAAERGVLATGGPHHTPLAWKFASQAINKSWRLVNPLSFPFIIPNSVPTSIARKCCCKAFAFCVGSHYPSTFQVIERAKRMISQDYCSEVLMSFAFLPEQEPVAEAMERSFSLPGKNSAICGLMRSKPFEQPCLEVLRCFADSRQATSEALKAYGVDQRRSFSARLQVTPRQVVADESSALSKFDFFTATGAVLMVEAVREMEAQQLEGAFAVALETSRMTYCLIARLAGG